MIITAIAHAPDKLSERTNIPSAELLHLAKLALKQYQVTHLITGLAPGWEQALAKAALEEGVPYTVAVPYPGRDSGWRQEERALYYTLIAKAEKVYRVSEYPSVSASLECHLWQVDRAELLLALWDYGFQGETYETMRYALGCGKQVNNLWADWTHLCDLRKARRVTTLLPLVRKKGARVYEKKA